MESLTQFFTDVNLPPEQKSKPLPNLSRYTDRFFLILLGDYQLRLREKTLQPDGSFWGSNKRYMNALRTSRRTIIRGKKQLAKAGIIRYRTHQGRGRATDYWILDKVEKRAVERAVRPDSIPYLEARDMIDCAKQFGNEYALKFYGEKEYSEADIKRVLGLG